MVFIVRNINGKGWATFCCAIILKLEVCTEKPCSSLVKAGVSGFRDQLATIYKACSGPNIRQVVFLPLLSPPSRLLFELLLFYKFQKNCSIVYT